MSDQLPDPAGEGGRVLNLMDEITIKITSLGQVYITDDVDDETTLSEEHVATLLDAIFASEHYDHLGSYVDYWLNDHDYYHTDDDSLHEDCISREWTTTDPGSG